MKKKLTLEEHAAEIKKIALNPSVNSDLVDRIHTKALVESAKVVYEFVTKWISYQPQSKIQKVHASADNYFEDGKADSPGMVIVFGQILTKLNIKFKIKLAKYGDKLHLYVIVPIKKGAERNCYLVLDPEMGEFNKERENYTESCLF
jgi:hypothetical protein